MTEYSTYTRRAFVASLLSVGVGGCAMPTARAKSRPNLRRKQVMALVAREAVDLGVPISLALAVAHVESNFNPNAESRKGARGVMQIMPATAQGEYAIPPDQLWNPRINIRLGLHFLARLIDRYGGRIDPALSYYNGGSAVGPPSRAKVIPATRSYVRKVNRLRRHYRHVLASGQIYFPEHQGDRT
jgi:soluble lytic murein transglycosylase-like protein